MPSRKLRANKRHRLSIRSPRRRGRAALSALAVLMLITDSNGVVLPKAFEQDFSVHQIGRVKTLVKPTIERGQQVETLPCSSLQPPESGSTGRRSELPDLS